MFGLTPLGVIHTLVSLVAIVSGAMALATFGEIRPSSGSGKTYVWATLFTAATGLGIFQHGGFGPPHALSILTLAALAVAWLATSSAMFGKWSRVVQVVSLTTTVLFHLIPGFTESLTRLPLGSPVLPSADAPAFKSIYGALLVLYAIGLTLQLRWLKGRNAL